MVQIIFKNKTYESHPDETVLACLERHQVDYPCACKSGVCQSCLAELTKGKVEPSWQKGLKENFVAKDYFLACLAKPTEKIALAIPGLNEITTPARVKKIHYFNENVVSLQLLVSHLQEWTPGQYINLINPDGHRRSYSIANVPEEDGYVELHIKLMPEGVMSNWIKESVYPALQIHIQGPMGECFYINPKKEKFSMILAGTGTGLAPLIAIARDAIRQQHSGSVHLIHGGVDAKDLYLDAYLQDFSKQHEQFIYESCVLKGDGIHQENSIDQVLLNVLQNYTQARVYVCGPEETTKKLKKTAFLHGVPSAFIYSDAFINPNKVNS